MTTKTKPPAIDKFELVSNQIIEILERGVKPWERPWFGDAPMNLISGHVYKGQNPLLCGISMLYYEHKRPHYVGLTQGRELGWKLIKGSKSTWIKWGGSALREVENADGSIDKESFAFAKWHNVFNVECWDDSESDRKVSEFAVAVGKPKPTDWLISDAERFVAKQEVSVVFGGDRAFYSPAVDKIMVPEFHSFTSVEAYYATLLHEFGHSTGHQKRLNRDMTGGFGSDKYAKEELIAELTAAFLCNELQLTPRLEHHASYIGSWLQGLKNDKKYFFDAVASAKRASEFLMTKAGIPQAVAV